MKTVRNTTLFFFLAVAGMIGVATSTSAQSDIAVSNLNQPVKPFCSGLNNVVAELTNTGSDTVFTVTVDWIVNGVTQPAFSFNGALAPGDAQLVNLGSFNFDPKTSYDITVTSSNPNGGADANTANDSYAVLGLFTQMSGSYSLGFIGDYLDFTSAVNDLVSRGVCTDVVFNVMNGVYTEQIVIPEIAGATLTKNITFQSDNADSLAVILTYPSSTISTDNFTLKLEGADYITFKHMTIQRSGADDYGRVVELMDNANNNVFTNLRLLGVQNSILDDNCAIVFSDSHFPDNDNSTTIANSVIEDGSFGISLSGVDTSSLENGTVITGNNFVNQFSGAIQLMMQSDAEIINNVVNSNSFFAGYLAITGTQCNNGLFIVKNKIETNPGCGIVLGSCKGTAINKGLVANNFVQAGYEAGVIASSCQYVDIVYNSVHTTSSDPLHKAFLLGGSSGFVSVMNNAFVNSGGGYAFDFNNSMVAGPIVSDNNDLYSTGLKLANFNGATQTSLADWITASGLDSNSVSADPLFVSSTDLHVNSPYLDNNGTATGLVADDIDGELRSAITPDIGADEFSAIVHDMAVASLITPISGECENANTIIKVVIENRGNQIESGFLVYANIGSVFYSETYTGTLLPSAIDTLTFSSTLNTIGEDTLIFNIFSALPVDFDNTNDTLISTIVFAVKPAAPVVSDVEICGTDSVTLTASGSGMIYWYDGMTGGNLVAADSVLSVYATTSATYYAQVGDLCPSLRSASNITVHTLPLVNLGNDTTITAPQTITLDAGPAYTAYLWNTGDTIQTIVVDSSGTYVVAVTDSFGCVNSDSIVVDVLTGLQQLSFKPNLLVYPNPSNGLATISFETIKRQTIQVSVVDLIGRVVIKKMISAEAGKNNQELDLNSIPAGIYHIRIEADNGSMNVRLIKE